AGCLARLQARDPASARARRRLGDQRRILRRAGGRGDVADLLHRVEGSGARVDTRARRAVRAARRARERALPGPGGDAAPAGDLGRRSGRGAAAARAHPDGTPRAPPRDRERGALSRERGVLLRQRRHLRRRRRDQRRVRHAGGLAELAVRIPARGIEAERVDEILTRQRGRGGARLAVRPDRLLLLAVETLDLERLGPVHLHVLHREVGGLEKVRALVQAAPLLEALPEGHLVHAVDGLRRGEGLERRLQLAVELDAVLLAEGVSKL